MMQKIKIFQVDAFAEKLFSGNPAAVCVLDTWFSDELMQSIANENNLAETAFVMPKGKDFEIRWFTPMVEVDLCGHATLAASFVLFKIYNYQESIIRFYSHRTGWLYVEKKEDMLFLDFPTDHLDELPEEQYSIIEKCIGIKPLALFKGREDFLAVINNEKQIQTLQIDLNAISKIDSRGLIVSAKGEQVDFVSRFFAPQIGIDEDPVTGSAHTLLLPYWAQQLKKNVLIAKQLSKRSGQLICTYKGDRCVIGGKGRLYLSGEINIE